MVSFAQLNDEQKELLTQFQAVTQSDDLDTAISRLTQYNWNLQRSVESVYEGNNVHSALQEELEEQVASSATTLPPQPPSSFSHPDSPPPAPHEQRQQQRRQQNTTLFGLLGLPFHLVWELVWTVLSMAARILGRPAITSSSFSSLTSTLRHDPRALAERFNREFELKYGETHLQFFQGGYSQALEVARRELRFLLVILQSDEHDDTEPFCRQTLASPELIQCVTQHNLLVWGGNVRETEAFNVASTLQATTYPFMAIIVLQQTVGNSAMKMAMVDRIEGLATPDRVIRRLETVTQRFSGGINRLRLEQEQREMERRLRQEQDYAYRESLKADKAKERQAREAREAVARAEEEARHAEQDRLDYAEKRKQYIRYLCKTLEDEPDANSTDKVAKLSFRLADGDRVLRNFRGDASLESMYKFIEAYPLVKAGEDVTDAKAPSEYTHKYRFTVISPFPRMTYAPSSSKTIAEEKGLWPSATLIVDADDDDDDEQEDE